MVFVVRKLDGEPQTLGEKLRALRRGQAVSLAMMEQKTRVQRRYLEALERGRYEILPEPLYTRNFIRAYARVLGADEQYFIELYEEECGKCDLVGPMRTPRQRVKRAKFYVWTQFLKFGLLTALGLLVLVYLGFQVRAIITAPKVTISAPNDAIIVSAPLLSVVGIVDAEATVYVNGAQVVVNDQNQFETIVDLNVGLNEITIEAERRYSRRFEMIRRVIFDPQEDSN